MARPFFSVLIPTYNRAGLLRQCLESLTLQDLGDTEIIVGDNASTDDTAKVAEEYRHLITRYIRRERNIGALANFQDLVEEATGRYVVLHQDDDFLAPFFLHEARRLLEKHPSATMFSCAQWFAGDGEGYASTIPDYMAESIRPFTCEGHSHMLVPGSLATALYLFRVYADPPGVALDRDIMVREGGYACASKAGGADILAAVRTLRYGDMIYYPFTGCTHVVHDGNAWGTVARADRNATLSAILAAVMEHVRAGNAGWRDDVRRILSAMAYPVRCRYYRRLLKKAPPADLFACVRNECRPASVRQALQFMTILGAKGLVRHLRASSGKRMPS